MFAYGILIGIACDKTYNQDDIYGAWKGRYLGKELLIKFYNNETCELHFIDSITDSIEIINGNFEIDISKKPIPLSITNIPQLRHPLYTILVFEGIDSIKLGNFSPRWKLRPISFEQNNIALKRVKQI